MSGQITHKRLGIIIPSSNVVVEPLAARHINEASVHFSRLGVVNVGLDQHSRAQFELNHYRQSAQLLGDAKVDGIVWGGTSASWLGFEYDENLCALLETEIGVPATTCVLEVNRQLDEFGAKRIAMVTPYTAEVANRINRNYQSAGFEIVAAEYDGGTLSNDFASISEDTIETMVRKVAQSQLDAIVIMCTNLAGATVAARLSAALSVPVIDSAMATLEAGQRLLALKTQAKEQI